MRTSQGKGDVTGKGISGSALVYGRRSETDTIIYGVREDTYEVSGGPRSSNDVEEGWISSLMDMVDASQGTCEGQRCSIAHYYMHRVWHDNRATGPSERRTKAQLEYKTRISVAESGHVMIQHDGN